MVLGMKGEIHRPTQSSYVGYMQYSSDCIFDWRGTCRSLDDDENVLLRQMYDVVLIHWTYNFILSLNNFVHLQPRDILRDASSTSPASQIR